MAQMAMTLEKKCTGDGGNKKRIFIKDVRIGSKDVLADPNRHLANGVTQCDYVETMGMKLGGQARRVLNNFIDKWDHTKEDNLDDEDAISWEAIRDVWRALYKRNTIFDLRQIHIAAEGKAPVRPGVLEDPLAEPAELYGFLAIVQDTFQLAAAFYLSLIHAS